ncbi:MAG: hypothetical protein V1874_03620 [Spirochaetota bacterium]
MLIKIKKIIFTSLLLLISGIACGGGSDEHGTTSWYEVTDFQLINTYNDSTRLTLLYPKTVSGNIIYIESSTDLHINTVSDFNNSPAAKTTKTVAADDNIYDDYITSISYGSLKKVYFYVLYDGMLRTFTGTTSGSGSTTITGSVTGSTTMTTTITLPTGYNDDTLKTWPFIVSLKGPAFGNLPCITLCVNISWSNNTQYNADLEAIKNLVKSIIEGTVNVGDAPARINKNKIYGFGFSAGGCAVMQIANDDASSQYDFIAIIGVGISSWIGQYYSDNLGDKNIWLFWGEDDDPYGPQTVTAFGYIPAGSGEHILTEMYDTGHTSTPVTASPYMYMWLLSK